MNQIVVSRNQNALQTQVLHHELQSSYQPPMSYPYPNDTTTRQNLPLPQSRPNPGYDPQSSHQPYPNNQHPSVPVRTHDLPLLQSRRPIYSGNVHPNVCSPTELNINHQYMQNPVQVPLEQIQPHLQSQYRPMYGPHTAPHQGTNLQPRYPIAQYDNIHNESNRLDQNLRHTIRNDLLKGQGNSFDGKAQFFKQWKDQLTRRLAECEADPMDSINIIIANTAGRPQTMVKQYFSAGSNDPATTLKQIWDTLEQRFGSKEQIAQSINSMITSIRPVKSIVNNINKLEDIVDTCRVASYNMVDNPELQFYNLRSGMQIVLNKLPDVICNRWNSKYYKHREQTGCNPDFFLLLDFLSNQLKEFQLASINSNIVENHNVDTRSHKVLLTNMSDNKSMCVYHQAPGHSIDKCFSFSRLTYEERKCVAIDNKLCFCCLKSHKASECPNKNRIKCRICNNSHVTAMHRNTATPIHRNNTVQGYSNNFQGNNYSHSNTNRRYPGYRPSYRSDQYYQGNSNHGQSNVGNQN